MGAASSTSYPSPRACICVAAVVLASLPVSMLFIQPPSSTSVSEGGPGRRSAGGAAGGTGAVVISRTRQPRSQQSSATCTPSLQRAKHNVWPCVATGWKKRPRGLRKSSGKKAKDEGERASGNRWAARRGRSLCLDAVACGDFSAGQKKRMTAS